MGGGREGRDLEEEWPCPKNCLGADLETVEGMDALAERKD